MKHAKRKPFIDLWGAGNKPFRSIRDAQVLGVCAGLSEYFGFDIGTVRVVTLVGAFIFFPTVIVGYCVLAFLLPREADDAPHRNEHEAQIRQQVRSEPQTVLRSQRHRFRELNRRLQRIEKYVTSSRFNLDREFNDLERGNSTN